MSLAEAARLAGIIRADPASAIAAAAEGWEHPMSRTDAILADLYDLEHAKGNFKKSSTYPRPFSKPANMRRHGDAKLSPADFHAIWDAKGKAPV